MEPMAKHIVIARIDTSDLVYAGKYNPVSEVGGWPAARFLEAGTCYAIGDTELQAISFVRHEVGKFRRR